VLLNQAHKIHKPNSKAKFKSQIQKQSTTKAPRLKKEIQTVILNEYLNMG